MELGSPQSVTVTGTSQAQKKPELALYSASVQASEYDKAKAVEDVNAKMNALISAVKSLNIAPADIQTQNVSIMQGQEPYTEEGRTKYKPGKWQVSNSVSITLRDIGLTSKLTDTLSQSGATSVSGPDFIMDETKRDTTALLADAVDDARRKAETIAKAGNRRLGKVLQVTEGASYTPPIYRTMGMVRTADSTAPIEPGTETDSATVTVTFELR